MISRNIVKTGPSTLSISLPKKWVEQNQLDKGNSVDIEIRNSSLIIHTGKRATQEREKRFILEEDDLATLRTKLELLYINNYKHIVLKSSLSLDIVVDIFKKYPGLTYKVKGNTVEILNRANVHEINPSMELKSIYNAVIFHCRELFSVSSEKIFFLEIAALKERSALCGSAIQKILENPLQENRFKLKIVDVIRLKTVYNELPNLFNALEELFSNKIGVEEAKAIYQPSVQALTFPVKTISEYSLLQKYLSKAHNSLPKTKTKEEQLVVLELRNMLASFLQANHPYFEKLILEN